MSDCTCPTCGGTVLQGEDAERLAASLSTGASREVMKARAESARQRLAEMSLPKVATGREPFDEVLTKADAAFDRMRDPCGLADAREREILAELEEWVQLRGDRAATETVAEFVEHRRARGRK